MLPWRPFFRFHQSSVGPVAIGMIFRLPAAADGDSGWLVEFENARLDIRHRVRSVAKRQIFTSCAAAVSDAFGDLFNNRRFDEVVVG